MKEKGATEQTSFVHSKIKTQPSNRGEEAAEQVADEDEPAVEGKEGDKDQADEDDEVGGRAEGDEFGLHVGEGRAGRLAVARVRRRGTEKGPQPWETSECASGR